jgi:nucleotide-binding universal stress UspA family protein
VSTPDIDSTRPLMLGYLCEPPLHSEAATEKLKTLLAEFAQREGYALGTVYVEHLPTTPAAFDALLEAIRRYEVDAVVVPTRAHLEPLGEPSKMQRLTRETNARVLVAESP